MVMMIEMYTMINSDNAELYVHSYDGLRAEGECITYTAQLPFFNNKIRKEFNSMNEINKVEWIIDKDRNFFNKFYIVQWWGIAMILIPILIPVMLYLKVEEKIKKYKSKWK